MDFLELVKSARTCRRFMENEPLSENDLRWLIECARHAPSARNAQLLRFMTVTSGHVCNGLFALAKWATALKDWDGPQPGERPTAFIAILKPEKGGELLSIDAGIACQTIQLGAASRGWGACILKSFDPARAAELLSAPADQKVDLLIALGVPAEKRIADDGLHAGSLNYWRDEKNVHHVPKLTADELIEGSFY